MVCNSTLAYGDILNPMKIYHGKNCENYIKDEVKWLYATFPQQPMRALTDILKKEHKAAKNVISVLKNLMTIKKGKRSLSLHGFISRSSPTTTAT